jgi:Brp/Blh family beta-carotene 15,15'-monooxygenase
MSTGWLQGFGVYADLAAILLLGLPHGALDVELARERFREGSRRFWFFRFAIPYLSLSALVLVAWHLAPLAMLGIFLAISTYHFGREQTTDVLGILVEGSAPIALAICLSPVATLQIFAVVTGVPLATMPAILNAAVVAWLALATLWTMVKLFRRSFRTLGLGALLVVIYSVLDPLTALALYFIVWHAPLHVRRLIEDRNLAPRISSARRAARLSLWPTLLTLFFGVLLWPHYPGAPAERLLMLTIQGLAALTVPHMLFDYWLVRDRRTRIVRGATEQVAA